MPLLHVERHGHVPDSEMRSIVALFDECYNRLQSDHLDFVEILIFESNSLWRGHASLQRKKTGVTSSEFDDAFIASHEAWTGIPRISISLERKQGLAQLVWDGALRHEAGHSILHGGLEYYTFPMPKALQKAGQDFPTLKSHLDDVLYLLSLAVKDIEVTRLLASSEYVEDQAAYARFTMKASQEDLDAWSFASFLAEARVLCLMGKLKDIAAGAALAAETLHAHMDPGQIEKSLVYIDQAFRKPLLSTALEISGWVDHDTFTNIERAGALVAVNIINPVMSHPSLVKTR